MLTLLAGQKTLLVSFLQSTREQTQALKAEDTEELLRQLNARQEIIEAVDAARSELDALLADYLALPQSAVSAEAADAVTAARTEISAILAEIQTLDEQNQQQAQISIAHFQAEMRRLRTTRQTVHVYNTVGDYGAGFVDERQ